MSSLLPSPFSPSPHQTFFYCPSFSLVTNDTMPTSPSTSSSRSYILVQYIVDRGLYYSTQVSQFLESLSNPTDTSTFSLLPSFLSYACTRFQPHQENNSILFSGIPKWD